MRRRQFLSGLGTAAGAWLLGDRSAHASSLSELQRLAQAAPGSADVWRLMRAQFRLPADFAYFNTAGLGASPFVVTERVKTMMDRKEEAPAPGHNEDDWRRIRGKCAALLGPSCAADEIALVSTATEGINLVLNGLPLRRGDEVITSTHEHVALVVPLLHKMKTVGIDVKTFEPDLRSAAGNVDRIRALLTPRTRLIFVSHVTCTTGQILPVAEIGRLAAERQLWFALDGAQSLAQFPWDAKRSGAHFYTASGHKWLLGPKRTGLLWVHPDHLADLTPSIVGAYSDTANSLAARELTLHANAQRFEYGTQNDALVYGLEAAVDLVAGLGLADIWAHNQALTLQCLTGLRGVAGLDVLSPADPAARSAMLTFTLAGRDNRQVASALTARRLRVRSVTEGGLDAVRASFHLCNGEDQVERLVAAITDMAARSPSE